MSDIETAAKWQQAADTIKAAIQYFPEEASIESAYVRGVLIKRVKHCEEMAEGNRRRDDRPTRQEFQAFALRVMKLVKELRKVNKEAPGSVMPYLRKVFNTKELSPETTSVLLWEATLARLENAASPLSTYLLILAALRPHITFNDFLLEAERGA